jgi:hypothetical protein
MKFEPFVIRQVALGVWLVLVTTTAGCSAGAVGDSSAEQKLLLARSEQNLDLVPRMLPFDIPMTESGLATAMPYATPHQIQNLMDLIGNGVLRVESLGDNGKGSGIFMYHAQSTLTTCEMDGENGATVGVGFSLDEAVLPQNHLVAIKSLDELTVRLEQSSESLWQIRCGDETGLTIGTLAGFTRFQTGDQRLAILSVAREGKVATMELQLESVRFPVEFELKIQEGVTKFVEIRSIAGVSPQTLLARLQEDV